jgi:chemotaxis family two-component system sensor kinase Cph1
LCPITFLAGKSRIDPANYPQRVLIFMQDPQLYQADLTNCDREPIHIPGRIQAHGVLLALSPADHTVVQASQNTADYFGQPPDALLGRNLADLKTEPGGEPFGAELADVLNVARRTAQFDAFNPYRITLDGTAFHVIFHRHDDALVLEFEPQSGSVEPLQIQQVLSQAFAEIQSSASLVELLNHGARYVRQLTGYDRVMVYRFHEDWHGEVVAEMKRPDLEPFLGLHYPASDIPKQARELYKTNLIRLISDVNTPAVSVVPTLFADKNRPLDLTHASLRAVSPIHIEYLQNMGVAASLSISLLYRGELWGLIACHNYSPRFVDYNARMTCRFVGQLLSAALEHRRDAEEQHRASIYQNRLLYLHDKMVREWNVVDGLTRHKHTLLDLNSASGAALIFENKVYALGTTPSEAELLELSGWLRDQRMAAIFHTAQLPKIFPAAEAYATKAAGLLAISLSRELGEYALWFKPERIQNVSWAGAPDKAVEIAEDGTQRLSPRKSFEKWTEEVRFTAEPWSQTELSIAHKLREDVLQVVSQKSNEIRILNEKLKTAYEELDAFSYTVSHDLRTPLASVKNYTEILLEEYSTEFNDDVRAILEKITRSADKMANLIRYVLHYSRVGRAELELQWVDMPALLADVREEVLHGEAGGHDTGDFVIGDTPTVWADPTMVTQIFTNLVSNAVKYSRRAHRPYVRIEGWETDTEVVYSVQDNGVGIDMTYAGKVFELFRRMDNVRDYQGSGVGLAIVKRIVDKHQGKIWFHSELGRGTTFFVSFPKVYSNETV